jgi:hypothetical protein
LFVAYYRLWLKTKYYEVLDEEGRVTDKAATIFKYETFITFAVDDVNDYKKRTNKQNERKLYSIWLYITMKRKRKSQIYQVIYTTNISLRIAKAI